MLAGEEWAPRTWPSPGGPPPLGCGIRGAGGPEAGLVSLSHHKVLLWAGRGSAGGPGRASALRTLLPGQLPPLAAPPPSSALGGTSKMGTPCHTAKRWKPPKRPLYRRSLNTTEHYSAVKKNETRPRAAAWMELEMILLSEVSQAERGEPHVASLTLGI